MGYQTILDYQLFANLPSEFVYRAAKDVHGFAMDRMFIYEEVMNNQFLQEKMMQMQATSFVNYQKTIY